MAVAIVFQFGDKVNIIGFRIPSRPRRAKPRKPTIWQQIKQAAYQLALGCMPMPCYGG